MNESMMTAALRYAAQGFKVMPIKSDDKVPLTEHGLKDATQLQVTVKEYWTKWPTANIAIVTDGLAVLDFDAGHGGLESKQKIIAKYGPLPPTRVHKTGGGGEHWIYRQNGSVIRNTTRLLGYQGVDLRGSGGYIVVPPSNHASGGHYEVISEGPIVDCPDWLLMANKPIGAVLAATPGQPIPQSTRNDTMIRNAGAMRRRGMTEEEILAALLVQNKRCDPPLTEAEVRKIAQSAARYQPDPIESLPQEHDPLEVEQVENFEQVEQSGTSCTKLKFQQVDITGKRDKIIWKIVDEWLTFHKGERFDLDTICRHLDIKTREDRQSVAKKLWREVKTENLKKSDRLYSFIDRTYKLIDWTNAIDGGVLPFEWPVGGDGTKFPIAEHISLSEGDLLVLAGVSNMGKTALILNILWANMDRMQCTLMGNEYEASKFKRRVSRMTWANPRKPDGKPKFDLIERFDAWEDIIRPDHLNLIDWISLGDNFYQIGKILEGIKSKITTGAVVAAIQKDAQKSLGMGGGFSQHLSSVYLSIDFERLTVVKAKEWKGQNPNGKVYGFKIVEGGTQFVDIRELVKCRSCFGTGKKKSGECDDCQGKGWVDAYHNY